MFRPLSTNTLHILVTQCQSTGSLPTTQHQHSAHSRHTVPVYRHCFVTNMYAVCLRKEGADTSNTNSVTFTLDPTKAAHSSPYTLTEGQTGETSLDPSKSDFMTVRGWHRVERNSNFMLQHVKVCQGNSSSRSVCVGCVN
jgi:hypothetical protein